MLFILLFLLPLPSLANFPNPPVIDEVGPPFPADKVKAAREHVLKLHNMFRAWHNAEPMTLDEELNSKAQNTTEWNAKWGDSVHTWYHENLFADADWGYPQEWDLIEKSTFAVRSFYGEICDPSTLPWQGGSAWHTRQVVSKFYNKIGIGFTQNKARRKLYHAYWYGMKDPETKCQYFNSNQFWCAEGPQCKVENLCKSRKAKNMIFGELLKDNLKPTDCPKQDGAKEEWAKLIKDPEYLKGMAGLKGT